MDSGDNLLVPALAALYPPLPRKTVVINRARALNCTRPSPETLRPIIAQTRRLIAESRRLTLLARAMTAAQRSKS